MSDESYTMDEQNTNDQAGIAQEQESSRETGELAEPGIEELKAQLIEIKDKYLRVLAEMENMKKRQQRQHADVVKYGKETVLREFLLVYDAIEKSIASALELYPDDEHFIMGLRMTERLFLETLKKNNVEPIQTSNTAFDPNYHEAMMQVANSDFASGTVVDEIEKGFLLYDRVLRPAKVTVAA